MLRWGVSSSPLHNPSCRFTAEALRHVRMDHFDSINYLYSLAGLLVGMLVGMTGIGGGSLMTPLLILLFGIHPETAVGTDLLYASATKTVGTGVHSIARSVDWTIVSRLAAGSIPATAVTIYALYLLGP